MKRPNSRFYSRQVRHKRVRASVHGTATRPRLVVFRSLRQISAQLIDDQAGRTLISATETEVKKMTGDKKTRATAVGKLLAEKASAKKITNVVFDRGGFRYQGRIQALAEAARANGLQF